MSNIFDDMDKALQSGHKSAFNGDTPAGTTVSGTITGSDYRQVTDYSTKQPAFFPSGDPKMQIIINLHTNLRDNADDDGERSVYIPMWGAKKYALLDAIKAAGMTSASEAFTPGNLFAATFVGEERKQGSTGSYTEKVYRYEIRRGQQAPQAVDQALQGASPWNQPQQPTPAPAPAPVPQAYQQPAPAPQTTPAPAGADPNQVQNLIKTGLTDQQIAAALGLDESVVSIVRSQMAA
jgi:hypothetical protein